MQHINNKYHKPIYNDSIRPIQYHQTLVYRALFDCKLVATTTIRTIQYHQALFYRALFDCKLVATISQAESANFKTLN